MADNLSVSSFQINSYSKPGSTAELRIWYSENFVSSDDVTEILGGAVRTSEPHKTISCTVSSHVVTVPSFTLTTTNDSSRPNVRAAGLLFDSSGAFVRTLFSNWIIPEQLLSSTTFGALDAYNAGHPRPPQSTSLDRDQILSLINAVVKPNASDVVIGMTKLSHAPVSASNPIALAPATGGIYNVQDYGIFGVAHGGSPSDESTAFLALLTTVYNAGGGTIQFNARKYRFDSKLLLPNDGISRPNQPSVWWVGMGASANGNGDAPLGGTVLDLRFTGSPAKIDTRGDGHLTILFMTLMDGGATSSTPFIQTTNTTIHFLFSEIYGNTANTPTQDAIICGGTSTVSDGGANAPYQGYHSLIFGSYFNRIQRALYGRTYANGIFFRCNTLWNGCGGSAAVEFLPDISNSDSGNTIDGNIIELTNYTYGMRFRSQFIGNSIGPNNFYDEGAGVSAIYRFESGATFNKVLAGMHSDTKTFVSDGNATLSNDVDNFHQSQYSTHTQPHQFLSTLKSVGDNIGIIHEDASGNQWLQAISPSTFGHPFDFFYQASGGSPEAVLELYRASASDKRLVGGGSSRFSIIASSGDAYFQAASGKITYIGTTALETVLQIAAVGTVSALPIQAQLFKVAGTQVVGAQGAAVADATDAASVITQLNALLARLRTHGLIG